jgi:hypothetical protein
MKLRRRRWAHFDKPESCIYKGFILLFAKECRPGEKTSDGWLWPVLRYILMSMKNTRDAYVLQSGQRGEIEEQRPETRTPDSFFVSVATNQRRRMSAINVVTVQS